jgi:hypothetical protein
MSSINNSINPDVLRVEGIMCKGFGLIYKFLMIDTDLPLESKAIYAYFASLVGNGTTTFPSAATITHHLSIDKDTYYKYLKPLTEQGYVEKTKSIPKDGKFSHNIYTLMSNPKKFNDAPSVASHTEAYNKIRLHGLKAAGYGMIPKAVMFDSRLHIKAKGLYAYFCSFSGSGNVSFPKLENLLFHLGIASCTYRKYNRQLIDTNYVTVTRRVEGGRFTGNDYYLNENPDITNVKPEKPESIDNSAFSPCVVFSDTVKSAAVDADTVKPEIIDNTESVPCVVFSDTVNSTTTINNSNIKTIINQSIYQQNEKVDGEIDFNDGEKNTTVLEELFKYRGIPYRYNRDMDKATQAIHILNEYETFVNGYSDPFEQSAYNLLNTALIEMITSPSEMTFRGSTTNYAKVLQALNSQIEFSEDTEGDYATIYNVRESVLNDYKNAVKQKSIKNHLSYMKACIWSVLNTGNISMHADLEQLRCC